MVHLLLIDQMDDQGYLHSLMIMVCINNEATEGLIRIYVYYGIFMQRGVSYFGKK